MCDRAEQLALAHGHLEVLTWMQLSRIEVANIPHDAAGAQRHARSALETGVKSTIPKIVTGAWGGCAVTNPPHGTRSRRHVGYSMMGAMAQVERLAEEASAGTRISWKSSEARRQWTSEFDFAKSRTSHFAPVAQVDRAQDS